MVFVNLVSFFYFKKLLQFLTLTSFFSICSCGPNIETLKSQKARVTLAVIENGSSISQANNNIKFSLGLFQALNTSTNSNLVISPYSISSSVAMIYPGARNKTEEEIKNSFYFDTQENTAKNFNNISQDLLSRSDDPKVLKLNMLNAIFGEKTSEFEPTFLDFLSEYYGAGIFVLDFIKESEKSRQRINLWVQEKTENKIENLIPTLSQNTRLILVNTVYLLAQWKSNFGVGDTHKENFNLIDGTQKQVDMMFQDTFFTPYYKTASYQALKLPYKGDGLSMIVVLPKEGEFVSVLKTFDFEVFSTITSELNKGLNSSRYVSLSLPKFRIESTQPLRSVLNALGVGDSFDPELADFSGITGNRSLYIKEVYHKAFLKVDEKGTEAAASSALKFELISRKSPQIPLLIDRPFLFFIYDEKTSTILFLGKVLDPSLESVN